MLLVRVQSALWGLYLRQFPGRVCHAPLGSFPGWYRASDLRRAMLAAPAGRGGGETARISRRMLHVALKSAAAPFQHAGQHAALTERIAACASPMPVCFWFVNWVGVLMHDAVFLCDCACFKFELCTCSSTRTSRQALSKAIFSIMSSAIHPHGLPCSKWGAARTWQCWLQLRLEYVEQSQPAERGRMGMRHQRTGNWKCPLST